METDVAKEEDKRIAFRCYCEKCGKEAKEQRGGNYCKEDGGEFKVAWPSWCRDCWQFLDEVRRRLVVGHYVEHQQFKGWIYTGDKFCRNCGKVVAEVAMEGPPTIQPAPTKPKRSFFARLFNW